jgi:hypothetical protein
LAIRCFLEEENHSTVPTRLQQQIIDKLVEDLTSSCEAIGRKKNTVIVQQIRRNSNEAVFENDLPAELKTRRDSSEDIVSDEEQVNHLADNNLIL